MASQHIAIPAILKVGKGTLEKIGTYLSEKGLKNVVLYFGDGLIDLFGLTVMRGMESAGVEILEYREINTTKIDELVEIAFAIDNRAQAVIGLGGGKVIDAAKYAAFLRKLPFVSVPTSASSDGFSSASASLLVEGKRTSVPARLAYGIIVDTDVIKSAPEKFIYSGIGDMVIPLAVRYKMIFP